MADLKYSLGLDAGGFLSNARRAVVALSAIALGAGALKAAGSAATASFNAAANNERAEVAIGTLTKSAQATKRVMEDVRDLSARTPFELKDLAPAARALLGAGTAVGELKDQLRVLGDVAAGADTELGGLVNVFNQVRGKGKLTGEEFIQFAERGVAGLREAIARFEGVSLGSVADQISKGKVSAQDLEAVFRKMTSSGGLFFQAMERQSQTFLGRLSTLRDQWSALLVRFGRPVNDALKPFVSDAGAALSALEPLADALGQRVGQALTVGRQFLEDLANGAPTSEALADALGGVVEVLRQAVSIPIQAIQAALPGLGSGLLRVAAITADFLGARLRAVAGEFGGAVLGALASSLESTIKNVPFNILGNADPRVIGLRQAQGGITETASRLVDIGAKGNADTARILAVDAPAALQAAGADLGRAVATAAATLSQSTRELIDSLAPAQPGPAQGGYVRGAFAGIPGPGSGLLFPGWIGDATGRPAQAESQRALQVAQEQRQLLQALGGKMDGVRTQLERINTR